MSLTPLLGLTPDRSGNADFPLPDDSSDDEHHGHKKNSSHAAYASYHPASYHATPGAAPIIYETDNYYNDPAPEAPLPGVIPTQDAYGEEIDSSDRESLQEARDDYEEALEDAASSSASSSDHEEVEEAREEYEEEYEEAYDEE